MIVITLIKKLLNILVIKELQLKKYINNGQIEVILRLAVTTEQSFVCVHEKNRNPVRTDIVEFETR